jgi:hypothetical protein
MGRAEYFYWRIGLIKITINVSVFLIIEKIFSPVYINDTGF